MLCKYNNKYTFANNAKMLMQKNVTVPLMQWAASFPLTFRGLILVGTLGVK